MDSHWKTTMIIDHLSLQTSEMFRYHCKRITNRYHHSAGQHLELFPSNMIELLVADCDYLVAPRCSHVSGSIIHGVVSFHVVFCPLPISLLLVSDSPISGRRNRNHYHPITTHEWFEIAFPTVPISMFDAQCQWGWLPVRANSCFARQFGWSISGWFLRFWCFISLHRDARWKCMALSILWRFVLFRQVRVDFLLSFSLLLSYPLC